ncbi:uncharacterized protein SPPG_02036 [Spizellomyces punctatus DAOM BR117]|uniref:CBS domain-containing protein n=1 Tax=Spizellomyces punctatus (strain DAOM BR117) TaxID=645134 RepID=A0A0L0HPR6_SPIPD|nr:uncharacterized protein SPPG_02036 [Spizellomyces punctatus DAOM BR117]KND02960.1 hypothetical protein SPPG_02036 [Spizellomyces punctatus DAOM BR117]|eukprot:XP_016610999.1 hypothetical protein SPPG_02036 [Spizellomyces punctatus DAOM BR117]
MPSLCPLANLTFDDLHLETKKPPVTTVPPDASIARCLEFMKQRDSIIVPIKGRSGISPIAAVVSVSDIVGYILKTGGVDGLDKVDLEKETIENVETLGLGDEEEESYRIWERDFRDTLEATMVAFARGIHRALITDAMGAKNPYLLTQSDIIRHVHAHPESVTPSIDLDLPIKVSLLKPLTAQKHVVTMRDRDTAIQGFAILREKKVAALPVVNDNGLIVANLSASDLRGITRIGLTELEKPVLEYLKSKSSTGQIKTPVVCTPDHTLRDIIGFLVGNHIHRVWVVETLEDLRPIGVVSQSDIIASFVGVQAQ